MIVYGFVDIAKIDSITGGAGNLLPLQSDAVYVECGLFDRGNFANGDLCAG